MDGSRKAPYDLPDPSRSGEFYFYVLAYVVVDLTTQLTAL